MTACAERVRTVQLDGGVEITAGDCVSVPHVASKDRRDIGEFLYGYYERTGPRSAPGRKLACLVWTETCGYRALDPSALQPCESPRGRR